MACRQGFSSCASALSTGLAGAGAAEGLEWIFVSIFEFYHVARRASRPRQMLSWVARMALWLLVLGLASPLPAQETAAPTATASSTTVEDFDEPAKELAAELKRAETSYRVAL